MAAPDEAEGPVSFAQEGRLLRDLSFIQRGFVPAVHHVVRAYRLSGTLDVEALRGTLLALTRRHDALRTVFAIEPSELRARTLPDIEPALEQHDLRSLPQEVQLERAGALLREHGTIRFDLAGGPLMRTVVVRTGDEEHVLQIVMEHLISDARSMAILANELGAIYSASVEGRAPQLPALPCRFRDFVRWQRAWLSESVRAAIIHFWADQLEEAPLMDLEALAKGNGPSPSASRRGVSIGAEVEATLATAFRRGCSQRGVTLYMGLLAALTDAMVQLGSRRHVDILSPAPGRPAGTEDVVGWFSNVVMIRVDVSRADNLQRLATRVRGSVLATLAHSDLPNALLVQALSSGRPELFSAAPHLFFDLVLREARQLRLTGLNVEPLEDSPDQWHPDVGIWVLSEADRLRLKIGFDPEHFESQRMRELLDGMLAAVRTYVDDPTRA